MNPYPTPREVEVMSLPLPGESECDCGLHEFCESPHICSMMIRFGLFPTNEEIEEARDTRKKALTPTQPPGEIE